MKPSDLDKMEADAEEYAASRIDDTMRLIFKPEELELIRSLMISAYIRGWDAGRKV